MYINLLIKIKNAQEAEKGFLKAPFSKMDLAVANLLMKAGYLKSVETKGKADKRLIEIGLKDEKAIKGLKFISRPSRKVYAGHKDLKSVKSGYGLAAVSTSKG